jgi:hypothetical protein
MKNNISIHKLISSPDLLVYDLETPSLKVLFKEIRNETYSHSSFLDERLLYATGNNYVSNTLPLYKAIQNDSSSACSDPCFIFHTSFCCSTLLARCFELFADIFVLKEPWILRRLADLKRRNSVVNEITETDWRKFSFTIYHLLKKTYGERNVVIKPTNLANNIIKELISQSKNSRAVMIYSSLEDFLVSNIKKSIETQEKMPLLAKIFARDVGGHSNLTLEQIERLPLLQACVVIWFSQFKLIEQQWNRKNLEDCLFINDKEFLSEPYATVSCIYNFFGYGELTHNDSDKLTSVMCKHSKSSSSFTTQEKKSQDDDIASEYKLQIAEAINWSRDYFDINHVKEYLAEVPRVF